MTPSHRRRARGESLVAGGELEKWGTRAGLTKPFQNSLKSLKISLHIDPPPPPLTAGRDKRQRERERAENQGADCSITGFLDYGDHKTEATELSFSLKSENHGISPQPPTWPKRKKERGGGEKKKLKIKFPIAAPPDFSYQKLNRLHNLYHKLSES